MWYIERDAWKNLSLPASLSPNLSPQHKERGYRMIGGKLRSRQKHKTGSTERATQDRWSPCGSDLWFVWTMDSTMGHRPPFSTHRVS